MCIEVKRKVEIFDIRLICLFYNLGTDNENMSMYFFLPTSTTMKIEKLECFTKSNSIALNRNVNIG